MNKDTIPPTTFAKAMGIDPHKFRDFLIATDVPVVTEFERGKKLHRLYDKEVLMAQYPLFKAEQEKNKQAALFANETGPRKPRADNAKLNAVLDELADIKSMVRLLIKELGIKPTKPVPTVPASQLPLPNVTTTETEYF